MTINDVIFRNENANIDIDSALFNINTKTAQMMWCDETNSWNKMNDKCHFDRLLDNVFMFGDFC